MPSAEEIIKTFLELLQQHEFLFLQQDSTQTISIQDLSTIQETLTRLQNQPLQAAADAIVEWSKNYPDFRDALLFRAKEISKVGEGNPANQETTLENKFPQWRKPIQTRKEKLQAEIQTNES